MIGKRIQEIAMTVAEMKTRLTELESRVATLEEELDYAQTVAGIKRGLEQIDRGEYMPARKWAEQTRAKHKLPRR
jgi:predicted transcriptional regulator